MSKNSYQVIQNFQTPEGMQRKKEFPNKIISYLLFQRKEAK